jgi:hypothetical protein
MLARLDPSLPLPLSPTSQVLGLGDSLPGCTCGDLPGFSISDAIAHMNASEVLRYYGPDVGQRLVQSPRSGVEHLLNVSIVGGLPLTCPSLPAYLGIEEFDFYKVHSSEYAHPNTHSLTHPLTHSLTHLHSLQLAPSAEGVR